MKKKAVQRVGIQTPCTIVVNGPASDRKGLSTITREILRVQLN